MDKEIDPMGGEIIPNTWALSLGRYDPANPNSIFMEIVCTTGSSLDHMLGETHKKLGEENSRSAYRIS
jgi:hypothetical protein